MINVRQELFLEISIDIVSKWGHDYKIYKGKWSTSVYFSGFQTRGVNQPLGSPPFPFLDSPPQLGCGPKTGGWGC